MAGLLTSMEQEEKKMEPNSELRHMSVALWESLTLWQQMLSADYVLKKVWTVPALLLVSHMSFPPLLFTSDYKLFYGTGSTTYIAERLYFCTRQ